MQGRRIAPCPQHGSIAWGYGPIELLGQCAAVAAPCRVSASLVPAVNAVVAIAASSLLRCVVAIGGTNSTGCILDSTGAGPAISIRSVIWNRCGGDLRRRFGGVARLARIQARAAGGVAGSGRQCLFFRQEVADDPRHLPAQFVRHLQRRRSPGWRRDVGSRSRCRPSPTKSLILGSATHARRSAAEPESAGTPGAKKARMSVSAVIDSIGGSFERSNSCSRSDAFPPLAAARCGVRRALRSAAHRVHPASRASAAASSCRVSSRRFTLAARPARQEIFGIAHRVRSFGHRRRAAPALPGSARSRLRFTNGCST